MRDDAERVLRALVGRDDAVLRDDQWAAVEALVAGRRRALVVQRTGWGKSAVYFVATALLRARGSGPTLIVSPLLALMRNQIEAAGRAGITAVTINSANTEEWESVEKALASSTVDVLLISPERLNNPDFRDRVLPPLAARIGLLVVDEAHCISDWGHDFRPDYRRIRDALTRLSPDIPVLATTATANQRVVDDVADQLAVSAEGEAFDVLVQRGSLERDSLRLGVLRLDSAEERLGWLAEHVGDLPGCGIIYTLTVAASEDVTSFLRSAGHDVIAYSGRTDGAERLDAEAALAGNRVKALVATSALGMGFDKPDLGFVVHLGAPPSPIAYYQQVGRAGRAVERADVLLLPGREDEAIWRYFGSLAFPAEDVVDETLAVLAEAGRPLSTAALETRVPLRRARLEMMLKVLDVDGAVRRVQGGWAATTERWTYDRERYDRVREAREREQQAMRRYIAGGACRMEFLRRELDDPWAEPCGRCDVCAGPWYPTAVSEAAGAAARSAIDRAGVDLEPRTMWPSGMDAARGAGQGAHRRRRAVRARPGGGPVVGHRVGHPVTGAARVGPAGRRGSGTRHRRGRRRPQGLGLGATTGRGRGHAGADATTARPVGGGADRRDRPAAAARLARSRRRWSDRRPRRQQRPPAGRRVGPLRRSRRRRRPAAVARRSRPARRRRRRHPLVAHRRRPGAASRRSGGRAPLRSRPRRLMGDPVKSYGTD